jgi:ferritin-like metal-binding protein YciE
VTVRYSTLETVLDDQLREIFLGELHIARQLPRLIADVSSSELRSQLRKALDLCHSRIGRFERVLKRRSVVIEPVQSRVVGTIMKQALNVVRHGGDTLLLDHGLVSVLKQLESYQRSAYESAREVASGLNASDVVTTLELDLEDHGRMERYFTVLEEDILDAIVARGIAGDKVQHPREEAAR